MSVFGMHMNAFCNLLDLFLTVTSAHGRTARLTSPAQQLHTSTLRHCAANVAMAASDAAVPEASAGAAATAKVGVSIDVPFVEKYRPQLVRKRNAT